MDTRHAIRDSPEPIVLSAAFNNDCSRFICGMENGLRVFRAKDCIRTVKEAPRPGNNIAIAETLDDRYAAIVGGGRLPNSSPNKVEFWDNVAKKKVTVLEVGEPIISIRMTSKYFLIVLMYRTLCLEYQKDKQTDSFSPASTKGLYHTASNQYGLCCINGDTLALPGETPGQVQVLTLSSKDKKVFKAHASSLRQMALSKDGGVLATASEQGTIIRVFSTTDPTKSTELRRGLESASIWGLAFSPSAHFIASTSDKGTLHIWDLRSPNLEESTRPTSAATQRKRDSFTRPHRREAGDYDTISYQSGSSSPMTAAGYMIPPPDLRHAPPVTAPSLASVIGGLAKGARSMTSTSFHLGTDASNWQGQPFYSGTTLPSGQIKKIKNLNVAVPGRPDGKPPKGILAWDPEGGDRRLWIVGGGADARWEVFELAREDGVSERRFKVVRTGFRRYLTRQFPEKA